jgi:hypothetical protein
MSAAPPPPTNTMTTTILSCEDIDNRLRENEFMLEEWRQIFEKSEHPNGIMSQAEMQQHAAVRRRINENLALLASQLKIFFAVTV